MRTVRIRPYTAMNNDLALSEALAYSTTEYNVLVQSALKCQIYSHESALTPSDLLSCYRSRPCVYAAD